MYIYITYQNFTFLKMRFGDLILPSVIPQKLFMLLRNFCTQKKGYSYISKFVTPYKDKY